MRNIVRNMPVWVSKTSYQYSYPLRWKLSLVSQEWHIDPHMKFSSVLVCCNNFPFLLRSHCFLSLTIPLPNWIKLCDPSQSNHTMIMGLHRVVCTLRTVLSQDQLSPTPSEFHISHLLAGIVVRNALHLLNYMLTNE
jgi:hypothetical protein